MALGNPALPLVFEGFFKQTERSRARILGSPVMESWRRVSSVSLFCRSPPATSVLETLQ